jgi:hypothetical protein
MVVLSAQASAARQTVVMNSGMDGKVGSDPPQRAAARAHGPCPAARGGRPACSRGVGLGVAAASPALGGRPPTLHPFNAANANYYRLEFSKGNRAFFCRR